MGCFSFQGIKGAAWYHSIQKQAFALETEREIINLNNKSYLSRLKIVATYIVEFWLD